MTTIAETEPNTAGLLAPAYRSLTIGTIALASMIAFEYLAVATAMPTVARELHGLSLYALAFGGSLAAGVVGLVVGGTWSDAAGPRRSVWQGVTWFVIGLVVAGLSSSMWVLIGGRVLQGFGGGLLSVALYVVVGRCYPATLHPKMFGAFAAAWVIPSIVGPSLTGLIVSQWSWRWIFVGIALLAVPAALLVRPALASFATGGGSVTDSRRRTAWALGAAGGAGVLHYGGQQRGVVALTIVGGGLLLIARFAPRLLPPGTVRMRRGLPSVIALRGIASAAFLEAEIFVPLMLIRERGLSPAGAGGTLTLAALSWSAASWYQGREGRVPSKVQLLRLGMSLIGVGIATTGSALVPSVPLFLAMVGWGIAGAGMGLVYPTLSVLTLELSLPDEQGTNSSALQLGDSLFAVSAIALGGSLFAAFVQETPIAAFVSLFGIGSALALAGAILSSRVSPADAPSHLRPISQGEEANR
ncbi:MAG: MFS transporter [Actinomycetota bacterium]|nr:MFS transporter [Actinomycetota bacterium]